MDEADAALIEQLAVFVLRVDDYEALLVVSKVTLDQWQGALADRSEADQYDGPVDTGMHWPFRHRQSLPRNRWSYPRMVTNGIDAGQDWPGVHEILREIRLRKRRILLLKRARRARATG